MDNLIEYVYRKNAVRDVFNRPRLDIDNPTDLRVVAAMLEGDLSPENLTCDGERPWNEVKEEHNFLISVAKEIKKLDPSIKFWELDHV